MVNRSWMLGVIVNATIVAVMGSQAQAGRFSDNESDYATTFWSVNPPLLRPGPPGSFDEVSVKDPSIVFHGNRWHLFYTARSRAEYSLGYVSAERLEGLGGAERTRLDLEGYAAAPSRGDMPVRCLKSRSCPMAWPGRSNVGPVGLPGVGNHRR